MSRPEPTPSPGEDLTRVWLARTLTALVPALEALGHTPGLPAEIAAGIPETAETLERFAACLQSATGGASV